MFGAGTLSGLLGIGSGALKVVAMDQAMKIPFKVSTTTSNFMIGVTAAASAGVYLSRGYIDPCAGDAGNARRSDWLLTRHAGSGENQNQEFAAGIQHCHRTVRN